MSCNVPRRYLRITLADCPDCGYQVLVLIIGVRRLIVAFEFDADRKIVAFGAAAKT